jgi:dolichol-phosphate mannosyltransferase
VAPRPELSVIVPVRDEADNLAPLVEELWPVLTALGRSFEVLCVDDGSGDGSAQELARLAECRPGLRVLTLAHPSGQSAALAAGASHATGDVIVHMDADLQNDPADLPRLLAGIAAGADAVCGIRVRREGSLTRRLSSRVANAVRRAVLGPGVQDAGCGLKAFRRPALLALPSFDGCHRFYGDLLITAGFRVVEVAVADRPRRAGGSKYGVRNRAWRAFVDLLAVRWQRRRRLAVELAPTSSGRGGTAGRPPSPAP